MRSEVRIPPPPSRQPDEQGFRACTIANIHRVAGKADPTQDVRVKQLWRGILRSKGEAQRGKKPLLIGDLWKMVDALLWPA